MMKIYELKLEQQKALEELEWSENDEEALKTLDKIQGDIGKKLEFLTNLLAESIAQTAVAKTALDNAKKRLETNYKRKQKTEDRLREFITSILVDFDINKFTGSLINVSHYTSSGALVLDKDFYIDDCPRHLLTVTLKVKNDELKQFILEGNNVPKAHIEYKEILRIS